MQFDAKNKRDNAPLEKVTLSHFNKICSGKTIIIQEIWISEPFLTGILLQYHPLVLDTVRLALPFILLTETRIQNIIGFAVCLFHHLLLSVTANQYGSTQTYRIRARKSIPKGNFVFLLLNFDIFQ